jgi:hypothetical protein
VELGLIEVSRSDPAEQWLIRAMMTVEPDLAGLVDQPMVFGVFGRARVLEPFVGKGITVDNLTQLVDFVTGACSCQVKDANPGVDLLTAWNWDAAAAGIAGKDSPLGPAGGGYAEIGAKAPAGREVANPTVGNALRGVPETAKNAVPLANVTVPLAAERHGGRSLQIGGSSSVGPARQAGSSTQATRTPTPFAHRLAWRLGLGALLGAAVVLAAGLVLVRHRGPV